MLLPLLAVLLTAAAAVPAMFWLERRLRRPGFAFAAIAVVMLGSATLSFIDGNRLLPSLFVLQAAGFLFFANWRRSMARQGDSPSKA